MDDVSEARLSLINPQLARLIHQLSDRLAQENITIRVTQGMRSWMEQQKDYAQGRTSPGKIITAAQAGYSWHQFGMAVDVVPMVNDEPDWNDGAKWNRIVAIAESLGLTSGTSWGDRPHLQLTGKFPKTPTDEVRQLYRDGGMVAVWDDAGLFNQENVNA